MKIGDEKKNAQPARVDPGGEKGHKRGKEMIRSGMQERRETQRGSTKPGKKKGRAKKEKEVQLQWGKI